MIKKAFIFITALAFIIIVGEVVEFLVPTVLGIDRLPATSSNDRNLVQDFYERQPSTFFLGLILANFIAGLVGGIVLGLGKLEKNSTFILGACAILLGALLLYTKPGVPSWYWISSLFVLYPGVFFGHKWVKKSKAHAEAEMKKRS